MCLPASPHLAATIRSSEYPPSDQAYSGTGDRSSELRPRLPDMNTCQFTPLPQYTPTNRTESGEGMCGDIAMMKLCHIVNLHEICQPTTTWNQIEIKRQLPSGPQFKRTRWVRR